MKTKDLLNCGLPKTKNASSGLALQRLRRIITWKGVYHIAIFCQGKTQTETGAASQHPVTAELVEENKTGGEAIASLPDWFGAGFQTQKVKCNAI
jgi:hypothetical protein